MTFRVVKLFYFGHILVRLVLNSCPSSIVERNWQSWEYLVKVKYSLAIWVFIGHTVEETSDTLSGHIFSLPMSFLGHILFFVHIFIFFWPFWTVLDILLAIERGPSPTGMSGGYRNEWWIQEWVVDTGMSGGYRNEWWIQEWVCGNRNEKTWLLYTLWVRGYSWGFKITVTDDFEGWEPC